MYNKNKIIQLFQEGDWKGHPTLEKVPGNEGNRKMVADIIKAKRFRSNEKRKYEIKNKKDIEFNKAVEEKAQKIFPEDANQNKHKQKITREEVLSTDNLDDFRDVLSKRKEQRPEDTRGKLMDQYLKDHQIPIKKFEMGDEFSNNYNDLENKTDALFSDKNRILAHNWKADPGVIGFISDNGEDKETSLRRQKRYFKLKKQSIKFSKMSPQDYMNYRYKDNTKLYDKEWYNKVIKDNPYANYEGYNKLINQRNKNVAAGTGGRDTDYDNYDSTKSDFKGNIKNKPLVAAGVGTVGLGALGLVDSAGKTLTESVILEDDDISSSIKEFINSEKWNDLDEDEKKSFLSEYLPGSVLTAAGVVAHTGGIHAAQNVLSERQMTNKKGRSTVKDLMDEREGKSSKTKQFVSGINGAIRPEIGIMKDEIKHIMNGTGHGNDPKKIQDMIMMKKMLQGKFTEVITSKNFKESPEVQEFATKMGLPIKDIVGKVNEYQEKADAEVTRLGQKEIIRKAVTGKYEKEYLKSPLGKFGSGMGDGLDGQTIRKLKTTVEPTKVSPLEKAGRVVGTAGVGYVDPIAGGLTAFKYAAAHKYDEKKNPRIVAAQRMSNDMLIKHPSNESSAAAGALKDLDDQSYKGASQSEINIMKYGGNVIAGNVADLSGKLSHLASQDNRAFTKAKDQKVRGDMIDKLNRAGVFKNDIDNKPGDYRYSPEKIQSSHERMKDWYQEKNDNETKEYLEKKNKAKTEMENDIKEINTANKDSIFGANRKLKNTKKRNKIDNIRNFKQMITGKIRK